MTHSAARTRFLAIFEALRLPFGYEESCKLASNRLLTDRCLVSFGRDELCATGDLSSSTLTRILWELGAPPAICSNWFAQYQTGASVIHFGFEADGDAVVHKIYLEYVEDARSALAMPGGPKNPVLVHRALKWKLGADHARETHYSLPANGLPLEERLAGQGHEAVAALDMSRGVLREALTRTERDNMILLDVTDRDSARRSYDLQVYDAGLRLGDVEPLVSQFGRELHIPGDALEAFFAPRSALILGHIASGKDMSGAPFATLYYGANAQ